MAARLWNKAPFVRLLAALAAGVVLQRYLQLPLKYGFVFFGVSLFLLCVYSLRSIRLRFLFRIVNGISLLLMGEILLCGIFFLPAVATWMGVVTKELIYFMNSYIEGLDRLPFSTWNFLSIRMSRQCCCWYLCLPFVIG